VLAAVVEKVSGKSYEAFLRENIFDPAGMMKTGYVLPKFQKSKLPHGYNGEKDEGTPLDHTWSPAGPYWNLIGNGGILSTSGDMYKWFNALQGTKVLSVEAKEKLFKPFLNNYAYGWNVTTTPNGKLIGHSGSNDGGFSARVYWYPEKDVVVVTLSNAGEYFGGMMQAGVVSNKLSSLVFSDQYVGERTSPVVNVDAAAIKKYEGIYTLASGAKFNVSTIDGRLVVDPIGQDAIDALVGSDNQARNSTTAQAQKIVAGIVKSDFTALRDSLTSEDSFNRYRPYFEKLLKTWETSDGALKNFEVLGTGPTWWSETVVPATIVRLNYAKASHIFRFQWRDDKISGIGGEGIKTPVTVPLRMASNNTFYGWHLVLARNVRIRFDVARDKVAGIMVALPDGRELRGERAVTGS